MAAVALPLPPRERCPAVVHSLMLDYFSKQEVLYSAEKIEAFVAFTH